MKVYAYKHSIQRAIYLLIGAVLLLGLSGTAEATDIFVTSTAESGPGTLRDALTSAADGDTIVLPAGEVFQMSTIFDDADNFMGPTATPMITLSITIEANGSRLERISGSPNFRAFAVGPSGNLTIKNAHIKGFSTNGGDGGNEGGGGGMGAGGAVYIKDGVLTVESCTFESNSAIGGNGNDFLGAGHRGGGGGLSGNGGIGIRGGGGGGGSRGDGGQGGADLSHGGGGGGGTLGGFTGEGDKSDSIFGGAGGLNCGGKGGDFPNGAGANGTCPGGGGGGGNSGAQGVISSGGNGDYGAGGGGSGFTGGGNGGAGGFGGGGGYGYNIGGNGGFGGGGGAGGAGGGVTGSGGFGGNGGTLTGGGGAGLGGAIFNDSGTVIILNSTFTTNSVTGGRAGRIITPVPGTPGIIGAAAGGAIFSRNGSLTVINSTISGNQSAYIDPGISVFKDGLATTFSLHNTIIANNGADECHYVGSVTHEGSGNFIIQNFGCQGNVNPSMDDPQLGPLQLNEPGNTPTMAIDTSSPAFDAGDDVYCQPFDQRGVPRPQALHCDIGAYEVLELPVVTIITPQANVAVQDGLTFQAQVTDANGIDKVSFYLREPDGGEGTPIGYEDLAAIYNSITGYWEYPFDTTVLQDGYYVILAKAIDSFGNEGWSDVVPFSIRNWAVITLLPSTPNNKAGRTMPVKFSLRIAASVDPAMPFVYNEDLEIRIYRCDNSSCSSKTLMQISTYGIGATSYRINGELYITNFKTQKTPAQYLVEIWRPTKNFLVGGFTFKTVK